MIHAALRTSALSLALATALAHAGTPAAKTATTPAKTPSMSELLAATSPTDWRPLDPENTMYMELPTGRVIIELAPGFGPEHAANIRTLVREGFFNNLAIIRAQDNYVVQWGDPNDNSPDPSPNAKPLGSAKAELPPEFTVPISDQTPFTPLPDRDGYAPQTGFSNGFPAARDPKRKQTWLTHCYGTVGVARGNDPTSGSGTSLYAIIGGPARSLDRNIAVAGRVVQGMDLLSVIPRGPAPMGFYEKPERRVAILKVQMASDVPAAERTPLEVLRTDTPTWTHLVAIRRNRYDDWYKAPANYVDVCNVPIPVRPVEAPKPVIADTDATVEQAPDAAAEAPAEVMAGESADATSDATATPAADDKK